MRSIVNRLALPMALVASRSRFLGLARQMRRFDRATLAEQSHVQQQRVDRLLHHARSTTDFWADRLGDGAPLCKAAPVGKSELEQGFPDRVVSRSASPADLRFAATRGTTQRMICVHDFAKRDANRAAMIRTLGVAGYRLGQRMVEIPPDVCDVVCGDLGERDESVWRHAARMARGGKLRDANSWRDLRGLVERRWVYNRSTYPPFGVGGSNPGPERLDRYVQRLCRDRPRLVKGLTTYLHQIARHAIATGRAPIGVAIVKPSGSGATPAMRRVIEQGFGGRYVDDYGSAELGAIAAGCGESAGSHLFSDLFVVEVLDRDGRPCEPGRLGELVVTDLVNHAMPLIRYRVGDLGRLLLDACPCGMAAPRIELAGRVHDAVLDSQGEWVSSFEIAERLHTLGFVDEFQLVEKRPDTWQLTIAVAPGERLDEAAAREAVQGLLGVGAAVTVATARTLPAEPGGKFRWVKPLRQGAAAPSQVAAG